MLDTVFDFQSGGVVLPIVRENFKKIRGVSFVDLSVKRLPKVREDGELTQSRCVSGCRADYQCARDE